MNVKQLIEKLSLEDPEKRIVVSGYEGGYDELDKIIHVCITPNPDKKQDKWWLGEFEECIKDPNSDEEIAILFPRKS
jgi:patatin-like phospholipase/acyl hydrolase